MRGTTGKTAVPCLGAEFTSREASIRWALALIPAIPKWLGSRSEDRLAGYGVPREPRYGYQQVDDV